MKRNKKIGILTMPIKENYGGIIQTAALYYFLERMGYEPYLIRKKYDQTRLKVFIRYILSHNPFYRIYDHKKLTKREVQATKLDAFIEDFFKNKTKSLYNRADYTNHVQQFSTVIVGSDQVWRYKYVGKNYPYYFLNYLPAQTKKISYAASFGVDKWEGTSESVSMVQKLLANFHAISVREESGVEICRNTFGVEGVQHVLDPTFLPDISFYDNIADAEKLSKPVRLFSYVLDKGKHIEQTLDYLSGKLSLPVNTIQLTAYDKGVNPSIGEWLYNFREAEFVVTDSFHGVVFCILYNKQFICLGNKARGYERFKSLLKMFGLLDRLVFDFNKNELDKLLNNPIDYTLVESIKQQHKKVSEEFLTQALNNG